MAPDVFDRARDLGEPGAKTDPSIVFNLGSSGGADVAKDKDGMIHEAIEADRRRSPGSR